MTDADKLTDSAEILPTKRQLRTLGENTLIIIGGSEDAPYN